jgi:energy-converting hydrogenase Eha subunit H
MVFAEILADQLTPTISGAGLAGTDIMVTFKVFQWKFFCNFIDISLVGSSSPVQSFQLMEDETEL